MSGAGCYVIETHRMWAWVVRAMRVNGASDKNTIRPNSRWPKNTGTERGCSLLFGLAPLERSSSQPVQDSSYLGLRVTF
jgi:hypothetical protein